VTKYKCRHGISHRKVIRSCHPKPPNEKFDFIFRYVARGLKKANEKFPTTSAAKRVFSDDCEDLIRDYETIRSGSASQDVVIKTIKIWRLTWEHVPAKYLKSAEVWKTLLLHTQMPVTALIRNLVKMTRLDILQPNSEGENMVCTKLNSPSIVEQTRIHPFHVLTALTAYRRGKKEKTGQEEDITWAVSDRIVQALYQFFVHSHALPPTEKRLLLAIDIAMEMEKLVGSSCVMIKEAAVALAVVMLQNASKSDLVVFGRVTNRFEIQPQNMNAIDIESILESIHQTADETSKPNYSSPFMHAKQKSEVYDGIILLTSKFDAEEAAVIRNSFQEYKKEKNPNAKCVIITFCHSEHVGSENDLDILEVEGVDSCAAKEMMEFINGFPVDLAFSALDIRHSETKEMNV
jgi:60 kDa SS-A/Ro ribonucleoprotein